MKRYERIDELVEKLRESVICRFGLEIHKSLSKADLCSIDTVRAEKERRTGVIAQLRELHKDLVELRKLTEIEFRLVEGYGAEAALYSNSDYIFNLAIPSWHHLKARRSLEVVTSNPDEIAEIQDAGWEKMTHCARLKAIIDVLEEDKILQARIDFLEDEIEGH